MKNLKQISMLMLLATVFFTACKKNKNVEKAMLQIPTNYVSENYATNVTAEASVRKQLATLTTYMKKAEDGIFKLRLDSLSYYFNNNGTPALSSITPAYYRNLMANNWFGVMVACSANAYDPANGETANNGGVYGARLLDKRAKETNQEIEKGLFEAAMYNHFVNLSQTKITPETVDKMLCIYGAHPNFPNTNTPAKTPTPDAVIAMYAARRDKNDGNGLYSQIKNQFLKLQAATKAGDAYLDEQNAAVAELKILMEKAIMATVIHYGFAATTKLNSTTLTPLLIAGGLHDLGENVGFIHGFKTVPQAHRKITDAQIDEILALLLAPAGADATMYKFVTEPVTQLPKIAQYQQKIKAIYGFTDAEMTDFKQNWVALNKR
jgi:hypothetical protein